MTQRDERGRFVKASDNDLESLLPELQKAAEDVLQAIAETVKARPLLALLVATLVGYVFASVMSR